VPPRDDFAGVAVFIIITLFMTVTDYIVMPTFVFSESCERGDYKQGG
jgi:hypothetical protein